MPITNVSFRGIVRNTDIQIAKDGEAMEMVNMHVTPTGAVQATIPPKIIADFSNLKGVTPICAHQGSGYNNIVLYHIKDTGNQRNDKSQIVVIAKQNELGGYELHKNILFTGYSSVDSGYQGLVVSGYTTGNLLILELDNGDNLYYLLSNPKSNEYIRQNIPAYAPILLSSLKHQSVQILSEEQFKKSAISERYKYYNEYKKQTKRIIIDNAERAGFVSRDTLFVATINAFDGNPIALSSVYKVSGYKESSVNGQPTYTFFAPSISIETNLDGSPDTRELISGVSLWAYHKERKDEEKDPDASISFEDIECFYLVKNYTEVGNAYKFGVPSEEMPPPINTYPDEEAEKTAALDEKKVFAENFGYYLIGIVLLGDLYALSKKYGASSYDIDSLRINMKDIRVCTYKELREWSSSIEHYNEPIAKAMREVLLKYYGYVGSTKQQKIGGLDYEKTGLSALLNLNASDRLDMLSLMNGRRYRYLYEYNARIHAITTLAKPAILPISVVHNRADIASSIGNYDDPIDIIFWRKDGTGYKYEGLKESKDGDKIDLGFMTDQLLICTDLSIKTIVISYKPASGIGYFVACELKRHKHLPISTAEIGQSIVGSYIKTPPTNISYTDSYTLFVSEPNNPLVYLPKHVYRIGAEIVGLCSSTTAVSAGQFGSYPLFVFAKDGVYALQIGDGAVLYNQLTPVSTEVCISAKTICAVPGGIAFAATNGCLNVITGTEVSCISTEIRGYPPPEAADQLVQKLHELHGFAGKDLAAVHTSFAQYLASARVFYVDQTKEIIVSTTLSPSPAYSYSYDTQSGQWSKRTYVAGYVIKAYPRTLYVSDNKLYDTAPEQTDAPHYNRVLHITRPMSLGHQGLKRLAGAALRAMILSTDNIVVRDRRDIKYKGVTIGFTSDLSLYLLGSLDGERYELIAGKENVKKLRDLIIQHKTLKSFRYFAIAIVGDLQTNAHINYAEINTTESYNDKLR